MVQDGHFIQYTTQLKCDDKVIEETMSMKILFTPTKIIDENNEKKKVGQKIPKVIYEKGKYDPAVLQMYDREDVIWGLPNNDGDFTTGFSVAKGCSVTDIVPVGGSLEFEWTMNGKTHPDYRKYVEKNDASKNRNRRFKRPDDPTITDWKQVITFASGRSSVRKGDIRQDSPWKFHPLNDLPDMPGRIPDLAPGFADSSLTIYTAVTKELYFNNNPNGFLDGNWQVGQSLDQLGIEIINGQIAGLEGIYWATAPFIFDSLSVTGWVPEGGDLFWLNSFQFQTIYEDIIIAAAHQMECEDTLRIKTFLPKDVSCPGGSNGEATVIVRGGQSPYTYLWSDPASQTTARATNLTSGVYTVTVTDIDGATVIDSVTITEPLGIFPNIEGTVWLDQNQNGFRDVYEKSFTDLTISLLLSGVDEEYCTVDDITVEQPMLNADGQYIIECVKPDNYALLFEINDPAYVFTEMNKSSFENYDSDVDPRLGKTDEFIMLPSGDISGMNAGIHLRCDNLTNGGAIGENQAIMCICLTPQKFLNKKLPSGGFGDIEYMWMYSHIPTPFNTASWVPIPNSNSPDYQADALAETTFFVRCARRAGCEQWVESSILTVEFLPCDIFTNFRQEQENNDKTGNSPFIVYPNPINDWFTIKAGELLESAILVNVFNTQGQLLFQRRLRPRLKEWFIDFSDYPVGVYFIRIIDPANKKELMLKVLKTHF